MRRRRRWSREGPRREESRDMRSRVINSVTLLLTLLCTNTVKNNTVLTSGPLLGPLRMSRKLLDEVVDRETEFLNTSVWIPVFFCFDCHPVLQHCNI